RKGAALGDEYTAGYWHISDVLRHVQRTAIEVENAPDKRKRLRSFAVQEVAALLDVDRAELLAACGHSAEQRFQPRALLTFAEVEAARIALSKATGNSKFQPRRDVERGEAIAIIAFANFKGGSGKTTSAVHFAQHLSLSGYRVLLVDLDSQGSATALFGLDPGQEVTAANSFAGWLEGGNARSSSLALKTYWP